MSNRCTEIDADLCILDAELLNLQEKKHHFAFGFASLCEKQDVCRVFVLFQSGDSLVQINLQLCDHEEGERRGIPLFNLH